MKRAITLGIGALALATLSFPAAAADLGARPIGKAPVVAPVPFYNWSGFYIGGHIGGLWGDKDWTDLSPGLIPVADGSHEVSGFLAGGQIGFNWQAGNWVFGIEGQASWTNADDSHSSGALGVTCFPGGGILGPIGGTTCATEMNWLGSVAGRIGYAFNNVLLYAKGGFAFANEDYLIFDTATGGLNLLATTTDETRTGWMVGAGLEYGFTPNWSFKIEYNYMDFGTENFVLLDPILNVTLNKEIDQQIHVVKAGINYRFNWGAPIVARY
jgi:outer membrane immunogenic protein